MKTPRLQTPRRLVVRSAQVAVAVTLLTATALAAQENPALRAAVRLAQEGRGDSARRMAAAELRRARPGEPAYVEALFWTARLASAGDSAERDLRRVAIEFSSSPWADDALLQLAQLAMAAGNPASALALAERVRSDYPGSELRGRAAYWSARAAFEIGDGSACGRLDSARAEARGDVEFQNQIAFHLRRCAPVSPAAAAPPAPTVTVPPASPPVTTPMDTATPPPAPGAAGYEVQAAAALSDSAAQVVVESLERAGYRARVVAGPDRYRRVRVGPYPTRQEAETVARAMRRIVGGLPFVVRVP